jgi:hypothetical protein
MKRFFLFLISCFVFSDIFSINFDLLPAKMKDSMVVSQKFKNEIGPYLKFEPWRVYKVFPLSYVNEDDMKMSEVMTRHKTKIINSRDMAVFVFAAIFGDLDSINLLKNGSNIIPIIINKNKEEKRYLIDIFWIPRLKKWYVTSYTFEAVIREKSQIFVSF